VIVCFFVFFLASFLLFSTALSFEENGEVEKEFERFIVRFEKTYSTNEEYKKRLENFRNNLKKASELNENDPHARFGVTKFSDLSEEEFSQRYLTSLLQQDQETSDSGLTYEIKNKDQQYPSDFNWATQDGIVTGVYDQGQCGSCWAFSTTENIESQWAMAGHPLTELAMQQLVSCDITSLGCNGGNPPFAYRYVMAVGGMESLADYPYTAHDGFCHFNKSDVVASISNFERISDHSHDNETAIQEFTFTRGPPSVCVDAKIWQHYQGGVFSPSSKCGKLLDHCVMITGWEQNANGTGLDAWVVRNSWGLDWGYEGYLFVEIGYDVCGIGQEATSSII
jgi:C1A family cysteine protease